jgi:protocatechuate 3,4-dioxygenase beta subunit
MTDRTAVHPPLLSPGYKSTILRAPQQAPILLPHSLTELTGPVLGEGPVAARDADLTLDGTGEAQGQRIVVHGQVRDADGRAVPDTLLEVWQANAAGRYRHHRDRHDAPLDPHFTGVGRTMTDAQGTYRFVTVKPGAYPWGNHANAWRPARSVPEFARDRLVAAFDLSATVDSWALGFRFDIVLTGAAATPMETR